MIPGRYDHHACNKQCVVAPHLPIQSTTMAEDNPTEELAAATEVQQDKKEDDAPAETETSQDIEMPSAATNDDGRKEQDGRDEADIQDEVVAPQGLNLDGANEAPPDQDVPTLETRVPAKKDVALREFMSKMDDYAPIVCTHYYADDFIHRM